LTADDLAGLQLAWSIGFPGVTEMRSQPVITEKMLFVGVEGTSSVYAFELATGCLHWTYRSGAPVRSALGFGRMPDSGDPILYFGDASGNVHVISALDGSGIWSVSVNVTESNAVTGTPVLHDDRLFVSISSFEVNRARIGTYECCKDHGGVRALDVRTGKSLWSYDTTAAAQPVGKNAIGAQTWGPSGAPVWTTPAIDVNRNRLYIGTGENYSHPATNTSDAIIALDLDSGEAVWVYQALEDDVYNAACTSFMGYPDQVNCPENSGPDFDFGASVIITTTVMGKDILLAGQKSGDVYALDPDDAGSVIWRTRLSDGTPVGGIHWGMSVAGDTVFVPVSDPDWDIKTWEYDPKPGITALDLATGEIKWQHMATRNCELDLSTVDVTSGRQEENWPECPYLYGYSGAATSIDGAVLAGALDGNLRAFSSEDGDLLWQFDTNRPFATINGVEAHGGALDNAGPAVGNGYLVLQSGYSYFNQMPGNVLLVFKKDTDR
jgi:polyvinyl alcohol dehydrogenase (cytochrome)